MFLPKYPDNPTPPPAHTHTPADPAPEAVPALLRERGVEYTDLDGWHALDEHEQALGAAEGRERIKVVPRDEMVDVSLRRVSSPTICGATGTSTR